MTEPAQLPYLQNRLDRGLSKGNGCWLWTGANDSDGYGQVKYAGKTYRTHRLAFFLANGYWPDPVCRHSCDTPACCNPEHLSAGTQSDNRADCVARKRQANGESHGLSKLNDASVTTLRALYHWSGFSQGELAVEFRMSQASVRSAVLFQTWSNVPFGLRATTTKRRPGPKPKTT